MTTRKRALLGLLGLVLTVGAVLAMAALRSNAGGDLGERALAGESLELKLEAAELRALGPPAKPEPRAADPTGRQGSGGCAVAHHAEEQPLAPGEESAEPPCARLFRTGFTGIEPTFGLTQRNEIIFTGVVINNGPEVIRSVDSGASWEKVSPQAGGQDTHPQTNDPWTYVDPRTSRAFTIDFLAPCMVISFTDDAGESWTDAPPAGCGYNADHQSFSAGPPPPGGELPEGYPNVVYLCSIGAGASVTSFATVCSKSLDGGETYVPTGDPAFTGDPQSTGDLGAPGTCQGAAGHIFVGPDGALYLPKGVCGQPFLAISRDEGATWTRTQVADNGMGCCFTGANPSNSFGFLDHEAGVTADAQGNIYYNWVAANRKPYLAISRDGGESWSEPAMIGHPGLRETVLPGMVGGTPGRIAMVYMGSANSPWNGERAEGSYDDATWSAYVTLSSNALSENPTFHSVPINDPADPLIGGECGPIQCQTERDFIDVQTGPDGTPWAIAADACLEGECTAGLGEVVVGRLDGASLFPEPSDPTDDGSLIDDDLTCNGQVATILGGPGVDELTGSDGDDVILGLGGADVIDAGKGDDITCGRGDDDVIRGGAGNDLLVGNTDRDRLSGGAGRDRLHGNAGRDRLGGGKGGDRLRGGNEADRLAGGDGRDLLQGLRGFDRLAGGPGRDQLRGGSGQDRCVGDRGRQRSCER